VAGLRAAVDAEIAQNRQSLIDQMARAVRLLSDAADEAKWREAVLDAARIFAPTAELHLTAAECHAARKFPVVSRGRVIAVIAAGEHDDPGALELVASLAGWAAPQAFSETQPANGDRDLHLRAQRFARVKVAEIQLYHAMTVREARAAGNLYEALKVEIDAARELFRERFLKDPAGITDYLDQELVRTLANDDSAKLGPGYPGPLA